MDRIRVALADDHPIVLAGIRTLLNADPEIELVGEATNGSEALPMIHAADPDVAVVDVSMPGLNGLELTERMDVDALVLVMLELEAAGVSVEPEAVGPPANRPVSTAVELPAPKPGTPPDRATEAGYGAATFAAPRSAAAAPPEPIRDDRADASRAVILAGLATVLILGAVLLML